MIGKTDSLALSSEEIVAKVIDGEAIIINLSNGYYYSTVGTGALVWAGVEAGQTPQDIVRAVTAQFEQEATVVEHDVEAFLAQLVSEGLIGTAKEGANSAPWASAANGKAPYTTPTLSRFEDMAHFFALDPPLPDLENSASPPVEP